MKKSKVFINNHELNNVEKIILHPEHKGFVIIFKESKGKK